MRCRIVMLSFLGLGQLLSVIALAFFIPHLSRIWYKWELGWIEAIKAEYAQGGCMMVLEFVVIAIVLIATIIFEVWFLVSASKGEKNIVEHIDKLSGQINKISRQMGIKENDKDDETTKNE